MPSFHEDQWTRALQIVERRLANTVNYDTWVRPIKLVDAEGQRLTLRVPDELFSGYIKDCDYLSLIIDSVREVTGQNYDVDFRYNGTEKVQVEVGQRQTELALGLGDTASDEKPPLSIEERASERGLIPDYGFDSFVKGPSNELAYAACRAVAEGPGQTYNPMFIYGGSGLGKTHLLQAIGKEMLGCNPSTRVKYVTSEDYMNELVDSIQRDAMQAFRDRYRTECDVLLIDDIQFLAGKEQTQTEFFHTFNALYGANKQIVLTSDRFPEEIPSLEERLRSRFQWGLIADIRPPQIETRIAILRQKAESHDMELPHDVAMYIATRARSNVRQLEGALMKLAAHSSILDVQVTLPMAKEILSDFLANEERVTTAEDIIKLVAGHFGVKSGDIRGERRHKAISFPRQIAMYLCREYTKLSYPEIGTRLGNRDHTTVLSGVRKIKRLFDQEDPETKRAVKILQRQLER